MKKVFLLLFILFTVSSAYSGTFINELELSIERALRGNKVEYVLHLPDGKEQIFTAADFTSGRIIERGGIPLYFELYKGAGLKKHNIMVNLQNANYYKLNIEKVFDRWEYSFHFYY